MELIKQLLDEKIIAVIRAKNKEEGYQIANAVMDGGIKAIEITFTIPHANELLEQLTKECSEEILIGAGTVLDLETCKKAIKSGAQYVVSPGFNEECALYCFDMGIPYIPGCMTVTEMMNALSHHVEVIKLFPGSHFGPAFIKSIKGPLPNLKVMVTGGVSLENVDTWLKAGADMLGVGGSLTKANNKEEIVNKAKTLIKKVQGV